MELPKLPLSKHALSLAQAIPGPKCGVRLLRDKLSREDQAWLDENIANPSVQHQYISDVLLLDEHKLAASTIARHRKGRCSCAV